MSYVVDVYRGQQKAVRSPIDYALFICFFPQLVAGPIVRAHTFFRDLFHWRPPSADDVSNGIFLLALGLTKKMAFADQFAKVANRYFSDVAGNPGMVTAWSGVFAFGLQIYFDFSGYTDMAIGMAKLLGFHFPVNFRRPYLASSITDFWRRWHISLSTLAARLSLHSAGREPAWAVDDVPEPGDHHASGGTVARGKLEFRDLGRIPRRAAQRGKGFPRRPAHPRGMDLAVPGEGHC